MTNPEPTVAGAADSTKIETFHLALLEPNKQLVVLTGMVGLETAAPLREEALELAAGLKDVVVDWSAAEYIDVGVLQVLLALEKALAAGGKGFSIAEDNPQIRHYLELAGLATYFQRDPRRSS